MKKHLYKFSWYVYDMVSEAHTRTQHVRCKCQRNHSIFRCVRVFVPFFFFTDNFIQDHLWRFIFLYRADETDTSEKKRKKSFHRCFYSFLFWTYFRGIWPEFDQIIAWNGFNLFLHLFSNPSSIE